MNNEIIYQNSETNQDNPLAPVTGTETNNPKSKFSLPQDKRLVALIFLGGLIVILLIISLIVTSLRPKTGTVSLPQITPTSMPTPIPTAPTTNIPVQFQPQINSLEQNLQPSTDLNPPEIDDTIGL